MMQQQQFGPPNGGGPPHQPPPPSHLMPHPGAAAVAPTGPNGFPGHPRMAAVPPHVSPGAMSAAAVQAEQVRRRQDFETLCQIISQWNANRLDLFALSIPNEVGTWNYY